jgi:uncharacterized membrane protein HdeD (DUF308 family)
MNDNTVVFCVAIARIFIAGLAVYGAIHLASEGKDGWGWMIFLAIALGCVTVKEQA